MNFLRVLVLLVCVQSCLSSPPGRHPQPVGGAALQGYDPVAYFAEGGGQPRKGEAGYELVHGTVTYRFHSEENRARFQRDPARYEPLYGGWCAYAMADGERVDINPESFLVTEEGLFLFYDGFWGDTRKMWLDEGHDSLKERADRAWDTLLNSLEE